MCKERKAPTLDVRLMESQITGVKKGRTNSRCPSYRESNKRCKEMQGPTPQLKCPFYRVVRLERVDCIYYLTKVTSRTAKNKPRFFFTSFKGLLISFYIRAAYMPLFPS